MIIAVDELIDAPSTITCADHRRKDPVVRGRLADRHDPVRAAGDHGVVDPPAASTLVTKQPPTPHPANLREGALGRRGITAVRHSGHGVTTHARVA